MLIEPNTVALIAVALINAYVAYQAKKTRSLASETKNIAEQTEKNTNSMKDALVASTKLASHAEGKEEGRIEGEAKAATLAEGIKVGSEQRT